MSGCIPHLSSSHSPVFLLNSCLDLFSAPPLLEDPLSRSYRVSLPSSLATNLSTPQYILPDYVCPFAVRVPQRLSSADFLGSMVTCSLARPRRDTHTVRLLLRGWICLPPSAHLPFNALFRQHAAVSLPGLNDTCTAGGGILTASSSGPPFGFPLVPGLP